MKSIISSVFSSLPYNYTDGQHLPNPNSIITKTQSQPLVQTVASTPLELLETQFVNGEISETEFLRKKQVLNASELKKVIEIKE